MYNDLPERWCTNYPARLSSPKSDLLFGQAGYSEIILNKSFSYRKLFISLHKRKSDMQTAVIIDGKRTKVSGRIIRQYRRMRGLTQEELGVRLNVKKSRISKIENDDNLDINVLINALKHLDVEAQVVVNAKNYEEMEEVYTFISTCVYAFAKAKGLSQKAAFNYLNLFKGVSLLITCYDVEITLPLDEILNDLTVVCQRNGGKIR